MKVCKAAQEKQDKKAKTRKDGTILSFLKPKAATVPSTVSSQAPVHSYKLAVTDVIPAIYATPQAAQSETIFSKLPAVTGPIFNSIIEILQNLVKDLPESVPEASEFNRLAVFGRNPKEFDDPALHADKLWETTLNGVLKSTLGWGTEGNMDEIICCGRNHIPVATKPEIPKESGQSKCKWVP